MLELKTFRHGIFFIFMLAPQLLIGNTSESWGHILGARTINISGVDLVFWEGALYTEEAAEVIQSFMSLSTFNKAFEGGVVIIAPRNEAEHGVYDALKRMAIDGVVAEGFKSAEGTAKPIGRWSPPFDNRPFVVITEESLRRSNAGLVHELLHHYYWAAPKSVIDDVTKLHAEFLSLSGNNFTWKNDPGHIFVYGCQYFSMGYKEVLKEHISKITEICNRALGTILIDPRGTTENGVSSWIADFVKRNGMQRN
ncbi:hypothetical protein [Thiorhodovibrio frisius]|uniref:Uncharacterized protein n=1 Tax=Thiorhodovibrio frisius TaxID=631362 RepID=H8Z6A4_9GAMM|nr:hypothetical protein [Thiorhodovibrio frisius]EIC20688.1 hypothetical protein Thi970DRAFT_04343 [Thiorhodovibrio frisius]WPL21436.1 hypothetical protein Thiofri_01561 [Thiorhodovibrio frisius]